MATTSVTMKVNPGFEKELQTGSEYLGSLRELAAQTARAAQGLSPSRTGRWRSSIQVVGTTADDMGVTANRHHWHWYEFGSIKMRPYAPFRGAIEQMGLQFRDSGK